MFTTPVLMLIFNRPETTALVFEQIKILQPKYFYVAADGPRDNRPADAEECSAARAIVLEGIDWDCEVKTLLGEENLGCGRAPAKAINWFFENVERGIILEDDCLPDQSFFYFCDDLLEKYKNEQSVISIGGTNLGYTLSNTQSYAYSRFMNMWGWATWRRSAQAIDYDMDEWKRMRFKHFFLFRRVQNGYDLDINWIKYWFYYFNLASTGKFDCWDYQWIFFQLVHRKISIFPSHNLIKNIGFTEKATHTVYPDHPIASLALQSLKFPLQHPEKKINEKTYEEDFIKKIWCGHQKESIFSIIKTKLLYIPIISKANNYLKNRSHN